MHTEGKEVKGGKIFSNKNAGKIIGGLIIAVILGCVFIDLIGFILLGFAGMITVLTLNAIVIVPTVYFGIPTRFKERIKNTDGKSKILNEGINFVFPLIDDLLSENLESKELTPEEISTKVLSLDKMEITIEGSIQYKIDDLNTFIEMTPMAIKDGMVDAIKSELGNIAGTKNAESFIKNRLEIEMLIKTILQLERAPYYYINNVKDINDIDNVVENAKKIKIIVGCNDDDVNAVDKLRKSKKWVMGIVLKELLDKKTFEKISKSLSLRNKSIVDVVNKLSPEKWEIKEETVKNDNGEDVFTGEIDKISFYKKNASRIVTLFEVEDLLNKMSSVEKLYGIKVETFRLAKLNFSADAQKAFEEKKSATSKMEAADARFKKKLEMIKGYIDTGLSPGVAVNLVETTTEAKGVNRQIISVEGSQSADLLAFAKLFAGNKGDKGGEK